MTTTNWKPLQYLSNRELKPSFYSGAQIWLLKTSLGKAKKRALASGRDFKVWVTIDLLQPIPDGTSPWAASIAPFSTELTEAVTNMILQRFNSKQLSVTGPVRLRSAGVAWGKYRFLLADFCVA